MSAYAYAYAYVKVWSKHLLYITLYTTSVYNMIIQLTPSIQFERKIEVLKIKSREPRFHSLK